MSFHMQAFVARITTCDTTEQLAQCESDWVVVIVEEQS